LNRFSLDEHEGYLRLATTTGSPWGGSEETSKNNVYILNSELQIKGQVEDLAPGEKIYAARFLEEKGYLVAFRRSAHCTYLSKISGRPQCRLGPAKGQTGYCSLFAPV